MTRYIFPEDRLAFTYGGSGEPIRSGAGSEVTVYVDPEGTQRADILTLLDEPIPHSVIRVGEDSLFPLFKGPEGIARLYARADALSEPYAMEVLTSSLLSNAVLGTGGGFGASGQPRFSGYGPPDDGFVGSSLPGDAYMDRTNGDIYWQPLGSYIDNPSGSGQPRFAGPGDPPADLPARAGDIYVRLIDGETFVWRSA